MTEFINIFGENENRKDVQNNTETAPFDYKLTRLRTIEVQKEMLDRRTKTLFYFLTRTRFASCFIYFPFSIRSLFSLLTRIRFALFISFLIRIKFIFTTRIRFTITIRITFSTSIYIL